MGPSAGFFTTSVKDGCLHKKITVKEKSLKIYYFMIKYKQRKDWKYEHKFRKH